jgi:hypothetical protein
MRLNFLDKLQQIAIGIRDRVGQVDFRVFTMKVIFKLKLVRCPASSIPAQSLNKLNIIAFILRPLIRLGSLFNNF